jgi:tRNA pseudouridine38-40 synthase
MALGVEYDGSRFHGWQRQGHDPNTVQEALESVLCRIADEPVTVICAGRTDTGVHGIGQVVHFETTASRLNRGWVFGSNTLLPDPIAIRWARPVADHFHARYSALSRSYRYLIYNSPTRPALGMHRLTWQYRFLNVELMQQAGNRLLGEHDFSSFRSAGCQSNTPFRCIHRLQVSRVGDLVMLDITANAFLQHMVRNIAGALMAVGYGKFAVHWIEEVLHARDRTLADVTAPPHGLYFMQVVYPEEFALPTALPPMQTTDFSPW